MKSFLFIFVTVLGIVPYIAVAEIEVDPLFESNSTTSTSAPIHSTTIPTRQQQCTWLFKGNPKNCKTFYQCVNGHSVIRHCPKNLHWNAQELHCDWRQRAKCKVGKNELTKLGLKARCQPNTYKPHPKYCHKYIQCGTFGQQDVKECTPGLHFDATFNVCNWPELANCKLNSNGSSTPTTISTTTSTQTTTLSSEETDSTTTTLKPFIDEDNTPSLEVTPTEATTTSTTSTTTVKPTRPPTGESTKYPILQPHNNPAAE